jgi:hypothetical protein
MKDGEYKNCDINDELTNQLNSYTEYLAYGPHCILLDLHYINTLAT